MAHTLYLETNSPKVNGWLGSRYAQHFCIRENAPAEINEKFVQKLWFEQAFRSTLETTDGGTIQVLQPGFWNHQEGPDFLRVALLNEKGEKEVGDAEIHLSPQGWCQHRHDRDANYSKTILHLVWKNSPSQYYPKTHDYRAIRQVELSSQLKFPLEQLQGMIESHSSGPLPSAQAGLCFEELREWSPQRVREFLQEAGWYRLQNKKTLWKMRVQILGRKQAFWLGIAEALGYSENKIPFFYLAQALPIEFLKRQKNSDMEALIFGVSGFLPKMMLSHDLEAASLQRKLWNNWWLYRSEMSEKQIPGDLWKRYGIRPQNNPARRLAALALIARYYDTLYRVAKNGSIEDMRTAFSKLSHSFWDKHYTFETETPFRLQLLGENRITSILFNVIFPIFDRDLELKREEWLQCMPASSLNHPARIAAKRLLGLELRDAKSYDLLSQEGLLQIYKDYCVLNADDCQTCSMPGLLRSWEISPQV